MKSVLRLCVAALSLFIFIGCSSDDSSESDDPNLNEPTIEIPGLDGEPGSADGSGDKKG